MTLPRILIIDDQVGQFNTAHNERLRRSFCRQRDILDITRNPKQLDDIEATIDKVAAAVFCSGQVIEDNYAFNSPDSVKEAIQSGWPSPEGWRWALVFLDLRFKQGLLDEEGNAIGLPEDAVPQNFFGLEMLRLLRRDKSFQDVPIVVLTSTEKSLSGIETTRLGIEAFVSRENLTTNRLKELLDVYGLIPDESGEIVGNSVSLLSCLKIARNRAKLGNENILIVGEVGTGKELLAKYIYRHSGRSGYHAIAPAALTESLIEAQLFGHKKGSFTGATANHKGVFEAADKGVLFLDEFGLIDANVFAKMMRYLETDIREIHTVGQSKTKKVDTLVIMATNRMDVIDASGEIKESILSRAKFKQSVTLPPLRERKEDIPILVQSFLGRSAHANQIEIIPGVMEKLMTHDWPENIRDLKNEIQSAIQKGKGTGYIVPEFFEFGTVEDEIKTEESEQEDKDSGPIELEFQPPTDHFGAFYYAYRDLAQNLKTALKQIAPIFKKRKRLGQVITSTNPTDHFNFTGLVNHLYASDLKTKPAREQLAYDLALIKTFFPDFVTDNDFRVFYEHDPITEKDHKKKYCFFGHLIKAAESHFTHIELPADHQK